MKNELNLILLIVLLTALNSNNSFAKTSYTATDSSGIYLTYNDFINGKLTNGFRCYKDGYTLWPQGFFNHKDIELKTPDTTIIYKRTDIWGYKDHKKGLIRVFDNCQYKVLCEKGVVIYRIYSPTKISYYFSKTLNDPVFHLTRKYLKAAYADNPNVLKKIILLKRKQWLIWDERNKQYLINRLF